jgi:hypothetical protein
LQQHSDLSRDSMKHSVIGYSESGPASLTINGCPAIQYEVRGTVQNVSAIYIQTSVETEKDFVQILAWTLASKWSGNQAILRAAVSSFRKSG